MANTQQTELNKQRVRSAWIFLAPMLVVLLMVAVWPLARTIWLSLTDAKIDMMTGPDVKFVGLDNYIGEYGLFFTGSEIISSAWWAFKSSCMARLRTARRWITRRRLLFSRRGVASEAPSLGFSAA